MTKRKIIATITADEEGQVLLEDDTGAEIILGPVDADQPKRVQVRSHSRNPPKRKSQ